MTGVAGDYTADDDGGVWISFRRQSRREGSGGVTQVQGHTYAGVSNGAVTITWTIQTVEPRSPIRRPRRFLNNRGADG